MQFSNPQQYVLTSPKDINLFMAGMGSGKTFLGGVLAANFITNYPEVKGFIGANTYSQLNLSTMYRMRYVWEHDFGMVEGVHYVIGVQPPAHFNTTNHYFDRYNDIVSFSNGAVVFLGSLENAKTHEGKEFAWAILDETKDSREEDVKEVILMRMREGGLTMHGKPWNPLYILTSPAKVRWLNDWFGLDERQLEIQQTIYARGQYFANMHDNKCVCISSTYHNAHNLPPQYIDNKRFDLTNEQFNRVIYGDPFMKTGGEFYSAFSRAEHVRDIKYIPGSAIHVTFDFNVVPYITALVCQVYQDGGTYYALTLDEFTLGSPNNKTNKLCQHIIARYGKAMREGGLFVYGDATGRHRDTRGITDYEIVEKEFAAYMDNNSMRVPFSNPALKRRGQFANVMFENKLQVKAFINSTCANTIADFEYIKETPEGTKHKEVAKEKKGGVSFEKYGHTSDAWDYFICECFKGFMKD